jgi:hypothetical protein
MDVLSYRKNGQPEWNDLNFWKRLKEVVTSLNLKSGGDFKFKDYPHIELLASMVQIKRQCGPRGCNPADIALLNPKKSSNKKGKTQKLATNPSKNSPKLKQIRKGTVLQTGHP